MKRHEECFFKTEAELYQELEDVLLRLAFSRIQREDAQRLEKAVAEMAGTPQGEEMETGLKALRPKVMRTISRSVTLERARRFSTATLPKIAQVAAVCLLAFFLGLTTAIATVQPVRVKVLELIFSIEQEYTEIRLRDNTKVPPNVPPEWKGEYYLTTVPEGLSIAELNNSENIYTVEYKDEVHNKSLLFVEANMEYIIRVDTEGVSTDSTRIHGNLALITLKDNATTIAWSEGNKYFTLRYSGSKAEAIVMAEGVTRIR